MASIVFNTAAKEILSGEIDLTADTVKVMLISGQSVYDPVREDDVVDDGTASAAYHGELAVSGYTAGFGSASRKTLSAKVFSVDDTDDEGVFDNTSDLTWTALGVGSVISGCALIKEVTDDTDSRLICFLELTTPITTNGSDFTLSFAAEGIINANT